MISNPYATNPAAASVGYVSPLQGLGGYAPVPSGPFAQFGAALQGVGEQAAQWIPAIERRQQQQSEQAWSDLQNQLTLEPNMDQETKRRLLQATEQRLRADPRYRNFSFARDQSGQIVVPTPEPKYMTGMQFVPDAATRAIMEQQFGIGPDEWNSQVDQLEYAHPNFRNMVQQARQIARQGTAAAPQGPAPQPTPTPTTPPPTPGAQQIPAGIPTGVPGAAQPQITAPPGAPSAAQVAPTPPPSAAPQAAAPAVPTTPAAPSAAEPAAAPTAAPTPPPLSEGAAMVEVNRQLGRQYYSPEQIAAASQRYISDANPVTGLLDPNMAVSRLLDQAAKGIGVQTAEAQLTEAQAQARDRERTQDTNTIIGNMLAGVNLSPADHAAMAKKWGAQFPFMIQQAGYLANKMRLEGGVVKDPKTGVLISAGDWVKLQRQDQQIAFDQWAKKFELRISQGQLAVAWANEGINAQRFAFEKQLATQSMTDTEKWEFNHNQNVINSSDPRSPAFWQAMRDNKAIADKYKLNIVIAPTTNLLGKDIALVRAAHAGAQNDLGAIALQLKNMDAAKTPHTDPAYIKKQQEYSEAERRIYRLDGTLHDLEAGQSYYLGGAGGGVQQPPTGGDAPKGTSFQDLPPIGTGKGQVKEGTILGSGAQQVMATPKGYVEGYQDPNTGQFVSTGQIVAGPKGSAATRAAQAESADQALLRIVGEPATGRPNLPSPAQISAAISRVGRTVERGAIAAHGAFTRGEVGADIRNWWVATGRKLTIDQMKPHWRDADRPTKIKIRNQMNLTPQEIRDLGGF